jgi:DNA-binding response OmpR family regulator
MKLLLLGNIHQKESLHRYLSENNIGCELALGYDQASEMTFLYEYDCILLGVDKEKDRTFEWLTSFVEENRREGILIISSLDTLEIKLRAFDLGVDDFLTIPYHPSELLARIKAVVRRKKFDTGGKLYFGNLMIDLMTFKIWVWNTPLKLTKKEYDILLHLIANKNKVVSKTALAEYLWGENLDNMSSYNFLIAHIKNLRKKLLNAKAGIDIQNSYGIGYQIIEL